MVSMVFFVLLGVQPLLFSSSFVVVALTGALASFFAALFLLGVIASAKCPSCEMFFVGSTVEDRGPTGSLFNVDCLYCGFPTHCLPSDDEAM